MATSGFLTVPTGKNNSESTLGSLGLCSVCEGLLGMKTDIAASAVMNCVFKKCELLLLYTVIDYMGWGGVKELGRLC